jgi:hypothetical protein
MKRQRGFGRLADEPLSALPSRGAFCARNLECGRVSREDERGWTARLTVDDEVAIYCPECDELEFGWAGDAATLRESGGTQAPAAGMTLPS